MGFASAPVDSLYHVYSVHRAVIYFPSRINIGHQHFISLLEANGYEQYAELPGVLVIYQKTA